MSMLLLLPLIAQATASSGIGTFGSPYASPLPLEIIEKKDDEARKRAAEERAAAPVNGQPARRNTGSCVGAVEADPQRSADIAGDALKTAIGRERVRAGLCLGIALSDLGRWDDARQAFTNARDAAEADDHVSRARLGAMAGSAALAAGQNGQALLLLAPALAEAKALAANDLVASISLDRARALVALKELDQAGHALAEARAAEPENAQGWLLSATLSRRQNRLVEAQTQIDKATNLAPSDPEVGLEAGVIAMLSGNQPGARSRWKAVTASAPGTDAAATARQYLAETEDDAKTTPATPVQAKP